MILENLTDREKALIYTHIIYRDTDLEDYHAKSKRMDTDFYDVIYKVVSKNVRKIKRNQNTLAKIANLEEFQKVVETMYAARSVELTHFAMEIYEYSVALPGVGWDDAVLFESDKQNGISEYILAGHFMECCQNNAVLDDKTMKYINKDVHNRIYTLISEKQL